MYMLLDPSLPALDEQTGQTRITDALKKHHAAVSRGLRGSPLRMSYRNPNR